MDTHGFRHSAITEACKSAQANGTGLEEVQGQLAALVAAGVEGN